MRPRTGKEDTRMKSKFFKDTTDLESVFESCTPDKVSVCLRLSRSADLFHHTTNGSFTWNGNIDFS